MGIHIRNATGEPRMKKTVLIMMVLLLTICSVCLPPCGCGQEDNAYASAYIEKAEKIMDEVIEYINAHPIKSDSSEHSFKSQDMRSRLDKDDAKLYDTLLKAARSFKNVSVTCTVSSMEAVSNALYIDHPETETYFKMLETDTQEDSEVKYSSCIFLPDARYARDSEDIGAVRQQVKALEVVAKYVAGRLPKNFSVIDKYRALACYICLNTKYVHIRGEMPAYAVNAFGAVMNGYSICQGYAIGFEYLCRMANLDCRRVRNAYTDDNMHFWDEVTLDSGSYYIDVTWCDGRGDYSEADWFKWFMFCAEEQHEADDGSKTTGIPLDRSGWE